MCHTLEQLHETVLSYVMSHVKMVLLSLSKVAKYYIIDKWRQTPGFDLLHHIISYRNQLLTSNSLQDTMNEVNLHCDLDL